MLMKKNLLAILLLLTASMSWAQQRDNNVLAGLDVTAERSRITAERKVVEDHFKQEETACYQKFAVNDCINASRVVRREKLADLRRQEISLNDAERKRKGAEQIRRMEEKDSNQPPPKEMQRLERAKPPSANPGEASGDEPRKPLSTPKPRTPHPPAVKDPGAAAAQAAQERDKYQRKLDDAAAHKAQLEKRNAERTKPAAKPLPPASATH